MSESDWLKDSTDQQLAHFRDQVAWALGMVVAEIERRKRAQEAP